MGKYFCQNKKCNENDNFSKSISNDIESILSLASEININSHNVYNLPVLGFNDIVMEKSEYNPKKGFALNEFIDLSREAMDNEVDTYVENHSCFINELGETKNIIDKKLC